MMGKRTCSRCGMEVDGNVALFHVGGDTPVGPQKRSCWECLTVEEKVGHFLGEYGDMGCSGRSNVPCYMVETSRRR